MDNKILDKLRKLLAKASSTEQAEADAFMQKAQALAIENDIDIASINPNQSANDMVRDMLDEGQRFKITQKYTNSILINWFDIRVIMSGNRANGRILYFIGRPEKVEYARYLHNYLNATFMNLWHAYKEKNFCDTKHSRESYLYGLWQGLESKLRDNKASIEKQLLNENNCQQYGLMVVNEQTALKDAMLKFNPDVKFIKTKTIPLRSNDALEAGKIDGRNINLNSALEGKERMQLKA